MQLRREPRLPHCRGRGPEHEPGLVINVGDKRDGEHRATLRVMPFARNDIITILAGAKSRVSEKQLDNRSGLALVPS
jgi:hypothetical protein